VARGADQHQHPQSDIEIAQAATMRPIGDIATRLGIPDEALSPYGRYKAKVALDYVDTLRARARPPPPSASATASTASARRRSSACASRASARASA
jgi:formate--tetrahydrofolate ligase